MDISFDTLSSFLTLIGLQTNNDFLCKHETDYVIQKLNEFFESHNGNVNTEELIEYSKTIVSDIEQVLKHIRSTKWFRFSQFEFLMDHSDYDFINDEKVIDMNQYGKNIKLSVRDFIKTKEFAFYNHEYTISEIAEWVGDAPCIFPIDFDEYTKKFMRKHQADRSECYDSDYENEFVKTKRVKFDNVRSDWV